GFASGAERREGRVREVQLLASTVEELGVLGHRARPAPFDEPDTELVQVSGDGQLVLDGQRQPFLLCAVAKSRVVDVEPFRVHRGCWSVCAGHDLSSLSW